MSDTPDKTVSVVDAQRVQMEIQSRFNPIRGLSPQVLAAYLDQFELGNLRGMALLMRKIEERDDKLPSVAAKRKRAPARLDWDVVIREGANETRAASQRDAVLAALYNCEATSVVDEDERGGFSLLIRQMMDAVGMRWSTHEIVWRPDRPDLTFQARHVPLWYFEHTTPRLRYLRSDTALHGVDLEDGGWMVTRSDGLMIACSILYMYKNMSWKDLLNYCNRFAVPGLHGKTPAAKGSEEWNNMVSALKNFGMDWAMVTNDQASVTPIDVSAKGDLPHPKIVDHCDRSMAILWRGADLSTISSGPQGAGASLQGEESDILIEDDCSILEDTLQRQLVPWIVRYTTGDQDALVEIRLQRPQNIDAAREVAVDTFLLDAGVPVGKRALLERYGRGAIADDDEPATPVSPKPSALVPGSSATDLANADTPSAPLRLRGSLISALASTRNDRLALAARAAFGKALASDLQPLRDRIATALQSSDADLANALNAVAADISGLIKRDTSASARVLEETLTAALFNGLAESKIARQEKP